jgi:hypothetical protein
MARDKYHELVKQALIEDGWTITHDPYIVKRDPRDLEVDLGAERIIAAEKGTEHIAVEIKSFLSISQLHDFYKALGQYNYYFLALRRQEPDRFLYMAVPESAYDTLFQESLTMEAIGYYNIKVIVYSVDKKKIVRWEK